MSRRPLRNRSCVPHSVASAVALAALITASGLASWSTPSRAAAPSGGTYYVSPGSVGGSCSDDYATDQAQSAAMPWCSVDHAAAAAPPGSTVYVRGGNYEHFTITNRCRTDWVTFKPYPGETVSIDGDNGGTGTTAWLLDGGRGSDCFIRIEGFDLTDRISIEHAADHIDIVGNHIHSKIPPSVDSTADQIAQDGVVTNDKGSDGGIQNVSIRGNTIENIGYVCRGVGNDPNACDTRDNNPDYGYCIHDLNSVNLTIAGNRINGCWEDGVQTPATGIFVLTDNDLTDIAHGASGHQDGLQIFTGALRAGAVIQRNNFHGDQSTCIRIQNGPRFHFAIVNNVCAGAVTGRCMDLEDFHASLIANNTCASTRYGSAIEDDPRVPGSPDGLVVENNIFGDAMQGTSLGIRRPVQFDAYRYNILTKPTPRDPCAPGCIFRRAPKFVNAEGGQDMRLQSGSVGIDAGIDSNVKRDIRGQRRPVDIPSVRNRGSGVRPYADIGAYEVQLEKPKRPKKPKRKP